MDGTAIITINGRQTEISTRNIDGFDMLRLKSRDGDFQGETVSYFGGETPEGSGVIRRDQPAPSAAETHMTLQEAISKNDETPNPQRGLDNALSQIESRHAEMQLGTNNLTVKPREIIELFVTIYDSLRAKEQ